jgi:hypothetical protein
MTWRMFPRQELGLPLPTRKCAKVVVAIPVLLRVWHVACKAV